jgi:CheY-like chemotaxis protein
MKKPAVCFVDDDPAEIQRFRNALKDRFMIGVGQDADAALADLKKSGCKKPDLFLVDLYFPDTGTLPQSALEELHRARGVYLKAEKKFRALLARQGQSSEGGFRIARDLRKTHRIGVAFFTRKGTLEDAISAYEDHDAVSVIKKPDPDSEVAADQLPAAYDGAMQNAADLLAGQILRAIRRCSWWGRHRDHVAGLALGVIASLIATAIWSVSVRSS